MFGYLSLRKRGKERGRERERERESWKEREMENAAINWFAVGKTGLGSKTGTSDSILFFHVGDKKPVTLSCSDYLIKLSLAKEKLESAMN